jgi:hypothetical protein
MSTDKIGAKMDGINAVLLKLANASLSGTTKRSFAPMPGGMPPMDPSMGGMPPMDPAAAGGMPPPPMDPNMMPAALGMDPATAMAGAGVPMDPSMAMAGGASVDPMTGAVAGAPAPAPAPAPEMPAIDPALQAAIDEAVAKATGKGGESPDGKPKTGGKVSPEAFMALQSDVAEMKGMLQKAIGYLMGAGKMAPEDPEGDSLGAADTPVTGPSPTSEKVANSRFKPSRVDPMLNVLFNTMVKR